MTAQRMVELRPFPEDASFAGVGEALLRSEREPGQRFALMPCLDGIPEADEVEAKIMADAQAWGVQTRAADKLVFGEPLQGPQTATTVRLRAGSTLLSDGPFIESKEFLAGICVVRCANMDEAVALAARFPVAAFNCVEVRPFMLWPEPAVAR